MTKPSGIADYDFIRSLGSGNHGVLPGSHATPLIGRR